MAWPSFSLVDLFLVRYCVAKSFIRLTLFLQATVTAQQCGMKVSFRSTSTPTTRAIFRLSMASRSRYVDDPASWWQPLQMCRCTGIHGESYDGLRLYSDPSGCPKWMSSTKTKRHTLTGSMPKTPRKMVTARTDPWGTPVR